MHEVAEPDLKSRTTLRLGGRAIAEIQLEGPEDAASLPQRLRELGGKPVYLGRGSNILAMDGLLPIVLVRTAFAKGISMIGEVDGKVLVHAGAGAGMPALLRFCLANELSGLEGLIGIPGTVGGAVAMNAGSFGCETMSCVASVEAAVNGEIKVFKSSEIEKKYRSIRFLGQLENPLILGATFALTRCAKNVIFRHMNLNFFEKKSKQPLEAWSAGCAFKNPANGPSVGILLDRAGFRGKRKGGMAFSAKHANFLVNEGRGDSLAAMELLEQAADAMFQKYGIKLELEVRVIQ